MGTDAQFDLIHSKKMVSKAAQSDPISDETPQVSNRNNQNLKIQDFKKGKNNNQKRKNPTAAKNGKYVIKGIPKSEDLLPIRNRLAELNYNFVKCDRLLSTISAKPLKHVFLQLENPNPDVLQLNSLCDFSVKIEEFLPCETKKRNWDAFRKKLRGANEKSYPGQPRPPFKGTNYDEMVCRLEERIIEKILLTLRSR